jgi:transcriptional regulator with XRE-family HTH domain
VEDKSQDTPGRNSDPVQIFISRFRALREGNLTQQEVADRMTAAGYKMHRSAVAKIESGDRPVLLAEAVMMAGILGVGLAELLADPAGNEFEQRLMAARVAMSVADWEVFTREAALGEARAQLRNAEKRRAKANEQLLKVTGISPPGREN